MQRIKGDRYDVVIRLLEAQLGTLPKNSDFYKEYIQAKIREMAESGEMPEDKAKEILDEEGKLMPESLQEKGWTGFSCDEEGIFIYDYMLRGFLKSAFEACFEMGAVTKFTAYKKAVDKLIFISPRRVRFYDEQGNVVREPDNSLVRSLRTQTARGPRVSIATSDIVNAGRLLKFTVEILPNKKQIDYAAVEQAFDYGRFVGLGQWRGSGGYGKFELVSFGDETYSYDDEFDDDV